MFTRTAPRALALAFVIVIMAAAALVLVTGSFGTATPGQDGVPSSARHAYDCAGYADGDYPTDDLDGACYLPTEYHGYPTLDTADYGTDIPRCAADDFNADSVARCYTERPGAIIIMDQSSAILATLK